MAGRGRAGDARVGTWREIAGQDPDWVVLSLPEGKRGGWSPEQLAATGAAAVDDLLGVAEAAVGPLGHDLAVDVGCGVGRLAGALAARFDRVVGIDVTPEMVAAARARLEADHVEIVLADVADGPVASATGADVVVSERVLQHLPADDVAPHLAGLVALLRPGGVALLQVPTRLPRTVRLQVRRRLWVALRTLGVPPGVLYWRLGLHPMAMRVVPVAAIAAAVAPVARVVAVDPRHEPTFGVDEAVVVVRRTA